MGAGHGHGHGHAAGRAEDRARLRLVLLVTGLVVVVELVGAWVSGSLALLADAGHMVTDAAAVALALSASYVAGLPATSFETIRDCGHDPTLEQPRELAAAIARAVERLR